MGVHRLGPTLLASVVALGLSSRAAAENDTPRLLLLLTVDQGRGDYLERFRPALEGGLRRLVEESVVFTNAHHFHAGTVTAAGHASLSTGRHPQNSGMVGNNWFDRIEGRYVYCVEDHDSPVLAPEGARESSGGRSPARLLGTGLADWIQATSPDSKVFSAAGKDRAAVIMGGKNADASYWFDVTNGHWVTSSYYASQYPEWLREFHRERHVEAFFGTEWTPLPVPDERLATMDIVPPEGDFPHSLGRASLLPNAAYYHALFYSPFLESFLFELAKRLVVAEGLGSDDAVDVLALSFSSIDTVGHDYGPNSREILDTILRLDRGLDEFFRFLDERVGLDNVAVSLSADHGVAPLPEFRASRGYTGGRLSAKDYVCFQRAGRALEAKLGRDEWFLHPFYLDSETLRRRNVDRRSVEALLEAELKQCPGIARVVSRSQLEAASASSEIEPVLELYLHSFHPDRSPDLYVEANEYFLDRTRGTTHGSPHWYDTHVLALVRWPGVEPASVSTRIHTVDLPVTLAALLGLPAPENVDGIDRSGLMR